MSNSPYLYDPDANRFDAANFVAVHREMKCYAYSKNNKTPITEINLAAVSDVLTDKSRFIWLGLYNPTLETVNQMQQAFMLHDLAIEDALASHQRAKVESYDQTLFMVMQTAKLENRELNYGTTAIFMGENYIISLRRGASLSYDPVRQYCHQRPEKLKMGPIFILHAILDFVVDNYLPITDTLADYLKEQERNIFSYEFSKDTLHSLYVLKGQLVHMRAMILPMQDICNFFINHKKDDISPNFPKEAKPYFRDVSDHILRTIDAVNGLNEMLSVAMDTYMAMVTIGQNDVVRKLAAWAGILAVPTAVAGIYGMNFVFMPELHYQYAYFVVLAVIFSACAILYRQFKKSGWL